MANLPEVFRRNRSLFSDFFHELDDFFNARSFMMPRIFDSPLSTFDSSRFDYDIDETDDEYIACFALPGFSPEDIKVDVAGNMLNVCACMSEEKEEGKDRFMKRQGRVQRSIMLPADTNPDEIRANYDNGMLEITIPKGESSRRRTIEIQTGGRVERQIQGKSKAASSATASKSETARH